MLRAVCEPANPVVLQAVARALHLNQLIAAFGRPEADQVRQARTVAANIAQQALEAKLQMRGGQTVERHCDEFRRKQPPEYERRLQPCLAIQVPQNRLAIDAAI